MPYQKLFKLIALCIVSLTIAACDSENNRDLPVEEEDTTIPFVFQRIPSEKQDSFEVDYDYRIQFSELMSEESLFDDSLSMEEQGIRLYSGRKERDEPAYSRPVSVYFENRILSEKDPVTGDNILATDAIVRHGRNRFALNTVYTLEITDPAKDLVEDDPATSIDEKNVMDRYSFEFITQDGDWTDAAPVTELVSISEGAEQSNVVVASSSSDDGTYAVWRQVESDDTGIWVANYLSEEERWLASSLVNREAGLAAERVDDGSTAVRFSPKIASSKGGRVAVSWHGDNAISGFDSIWVNILESGQWSGAQEISLNSSADARSSAIAIDDDGNIVVVWNEIVGDDSVVQSRSYTKQSELWAWSDTVVKLSGDGSYSVIDPEIQMNGHGFTLVVWTQDNNLEKQIYSNQMSINQSATWSGALAISDTDDLLADATNHRVSLGENDDAFVIWTQVDGARDSIVVNRLSSHSWQGSELLEVENRGDASNPFVSIGPREKSFAIWNQHDGSQNSVIIKTFSTESGWDEEKINSVSIKATNIKLAIDEEGNAIAFWNAGTLYALRYSLLTDEWSSATNRFEANLAGTEDIVNLTTIEQDGRFLALWHEKLAGDDKITSAFFGDL